ERLSRFRVNAVVVGLAVLVVPDLFNRGDESFAGHLGLVLVFVFVLRVWGAVVLGAFRHYAVFHRFRFNENFKLYIRCGRG
ncbi:hypothetical protein, partial [Mesorhizobium japonicum]|uniref:hypothetical protein n=1 Tax=Mesorhizobium japonicum TaxID=2066070 RepID=UPI003B5AFE9E